MTSKTITRRGFCGSVASMGAAMTVTPAFASETKAKDHKIKLGFDNFSVRACKWNASQLLDYAASLRVDTLLLSDLEVYESFEDDYLRGLKRKADELGVEVHVGTGGICPTSKRLITKYGSPEEHLALVIRVAKYMGSPVARCFLGSRDDRKGEGGIYRHIKSTVELLKKVRKLALDAKVTFAVENHAGDLQAWELVDLIEKAGKDFVGATMDSGNATWTIEDPMINLEQLGPYAVSTGLRDSEVWETEKGANVMWANMGDGVVDWNAYLELYKKLCPDTPFILEIISGVYPRPLDYLEKEFWDIYPKARASEFAMFLALAKQGKPYVSPEGRPEGDNKKQQMWDLEQSLKYCKDVLGLGLKA